MDVYIFQADILCKECGENIKKVLPAPVNYIFGDESSYDSDQWPKGPIKEFFMINYNNMKKP